MKILTTENITAADVERLKEAVKKAEREYAHAVAMYEPTMVERRLATAMHDAECRQNHTDGCGWGWEKAPSAAGWAGAEHRYYVAKVQNGIKQVKARKSELANK